MNYSKNDNQIISSLPDNAWFTASGPLSIPLTNDYLFRSILQSDNDVLKGLIGSLLHLHAGEIVSADILNPIELGKSIDDKTYILDIKVLFNNNSIVHLEMQVINHHDWPERSLSYLCRSFDQLKQGKAYQTAQAVIQIGLLDFTLFPEHPEFYATYQLLNVKNYTKYSDKLRLSVLDLTQTELATEEDRLYRIDRWAALFKATTWEELKMLAENNSDITSASAAVYRLSQDEQIRMQCEAREDYYRRQASIQYEMDRQKEKLAMQKDEIAIQNAEIAMQKDEIAMRNKEIAIQDAEIQRLTARNQELLAEREALSAEKEALSAEQKAWSAERELLLAKINAK